MEVVILDLSPLVIHIVELISGGISLLLDEFFSLILDLLDVVNISLELKNFSLKIIEFLLVLSGGCFGPVSWSVGYSSWVVLFEAALGFVGFSLLLLKVFSVTFKSVNESLVPLEFFSNSVLLNFIEISLVLLILVVKVINVAVEVVHVFVFSVDLLIEASDFLIIALILSWVSGSLHLEIEIFDLSIHVLDEELGVHEIIIGSLTLSLSVLSGSCVGLECTLLLFSSGGFSSGVFVGLLFALPHVHEIS